MSSDAGEHQNESSLLTVDDSICDLLECPVCFKEIYPPIYQCVNGHILCSECKPILQNQCPTCRSKLGSIRCLALEKVVASLTVACKYQSSGCVAMHPYLSKLEHEQQCTFKPYNCPYNCNPECTVVGDIPHVVAHLKDGHKAYIGNCSNFEICYENLNEAKNRVWDLKVYSCFGEYFCLYFEAFVLKNAPVYIAFLQFMGDDNEAQNYSYSLEVGNSRRKQSWQGVPRSIRDSHRKVRDSYDGLIIQQHIAHYFSGGDGMKLDLKGTGKIWREN